MKDKPVYDSLLQELQAHQIELEFQNEELRIAQQALEESKEEYRELYDLAPVGYLVIDHENTILKANLTSSSLLNVNHQKLLDLSFTKFIHHDDQDLFYIFKKKLALLQSPRVLEIRMKRLDGEIFWARIESTYSKLLEANHQLRLIISDITDKKQAEANSIDEKNKFENLVYALNQSAIVSIVNTDGILIFANDKFCEISGFKREELIGNDSKLIKSIFHEYDFFASLETELSPEGTWQGIICNTTKDGNVYWLETTISSIHSEKNEKQYIAIYFDITARKKAEQMLLQSSKMASLGEMASGIAHEINNPLTIIVGKINRIKRLMAELSINNDQLSEDLDKIKTTSDRISKIIKGLHSFSRNTLNDPYDNIPLKKLITDTLELCFEKFKHDGIEFNFEISFDVEIQCRGAEISQVMLNLLNNAYDAIRELPVKWIRIEMHLQSSERIQLLFIDSGLGIPKEISEKIMLPFFTTKDVNKGTGLGLSISKRIMEDHWGNLILDSSMPNTCFILELPIFQKLEHAEKQDLH